MDKPIYNHVTGALDAPEKTDSPDVSGTYCRFHIPSFCTGADQHCVAGRASVQQDCWGACVLCVDCRTEVVQGCACWGCCPDCAWRSCRC